MSDRLIDIAVVARLFNVSAETVRNWIRAGKVHAIPTPSGYYKITETELERLKESRESPNQP